MPILTGILSNRHPRTAPAVLFVHEKPPSHNEGRSFGAFRAQKNRPLITKGRDQYRFRGTTLLRGRLAPTASQSTAKPGDTPAPDNGVLSVVAYSGLALWVRDSKMYSRDSIHAPLTEPATLCAKSNPLLFLITVCVMLRKRRALPQLLREIVARCISGVKQQDRIFVMILSCAFPVR